MYTLFEASPKSPILQHESDDDADISTITANWQLWCRLCAKEDPQGNVGILLVGDQHTDPLTIESTKTLDDQVLTVNLSLESSIAKYFSIEITSDDKLPKMLCTECFSLITSLKNFTERVIKVQKMFLTLKENSESSKTVNINDIRLEYGLLSEDPKHVLIHHPVREVHYVEANNNKIECCESDKKTIVNPLKERRIKTKLKKEDAPEDLDDECKNDDGNNNLDTSLMDNTSLPVKRARRSKRNEKAEAPKSETSVTPSMKLPTQQQYSCPECSRIFKWKHGYKTHLLTHLPEEEKKQFPCSYCDKKFITKFRVTQHTRSAHMDDRPFACTKCDKTFKHNHYLKNHMEVHNPNKHICDECGLQLSSRATLTAHLLVHSDERNHKCDYCGRAFKSAKNLKHHLLLHTGLRLYSCNFCSRSYNNASACRAHKKNAHPKELAALEAAGGGETYTRVPTLEDLKTFARTAGNSKSNSEVVANRMQYRLKKFPTSGGNDETSKPCSESELNKNRVRYTFVRE